MIMFGFILTLCFAAEPDILLLNGESVPFADAPAYIDQLQKELDRFRFRKPAPTCAVPLVNFAVHDGDTLIHADILCPFGVTLRNRAIRAAGYDAWEIDRTRQTVTVTDAEIERGKAAKAALEQLISSGTLYIEDSGKSDPYGRVSGALGVRTKTGEWIDVAEFMRTNHHTRR
jgi:endonuclease YncB( thermonuclease family)